MCAQRKLRSAWASAQSKDQSFLHADSKDFDQTGLILVCTCYHVGFVMLWLNYNKTLGTQRGKHSTDKTQTETELGTGNR